MLVHLCQKLFDHICESISELRSVALIRDLLANTIWSSLLSLHSKFWGQVVWVLRSCFSFSKLFDYLVTIPFHINFIIGLLLSAKYPSGVWLDLHYYVDLGRADTLTVLNLLVHEHSMSPFWHYLFCGFQHMDPPCIFSDS